MMRKCARFLSLERNPEKPKQRFSKVVHRGGREELFGHEVSAFQLMEKYPGTRVVRDDFFENPYESVLGPEEKLSLGRKYLVVPSKAVRRLQRKHPEKRPSESSEWDSVVMESRESSGDFEEAVFSAKDFFVPRGKKSPKSLAARRGVRRKKPFVPPLPKTRSCRGLAWEPSLTSVQELSPP